jgi:hypothetical protein
MQRAISDQLADHRSVWERKGVLRVVYDDFYGRIAGACGDGLTIEIGGGIGNLKRRLTEVVATDICMSSEHFGQLAWQFKRVSGSSGLKVQAAIAC